MATSERLAKLEAQVQALGQAWLYLTAASEIAGSHDPTKLDKALRQLHWDQPEMNKLAKAFLDGLLIELAAARRRRQEQGRR
ncbi:hypothetical protein PVT67_15520 [Gallaecimonas kandeliae]|uniref:hypothetical protein n=1 Tax=Gallaecimonas kandeliae TaxID=3029055 RepID=UPI0026494896|nr:hypothetical protein [Gallaecimonas kandeliae]WKE65052.1 hypothetical protein PVT67_15520 [Gallaecimonas kandeliae]